MAELLTAAGYRTAEGVYADGADTVYAKMLAAGAKPHFIPFYALVLGLMGRPWNDASDAEKAEFRIRFDAIKAAHMRPSLDAEVPHDLGQFLNQIGVIVKS